MSVEVNHYILPESGCPANPHEDPGEAHTAASSDPTI